MVWGQAYGEVPSAPAADPFAVAERDTRSMVAAAWWPATPPQQRQNLVAGRMLALPDGSWWVFGAWGRWYRWAPGTGQWYLCPPPRLTVTRMSARSLRPGMPVPQIPPHIVPAGPDLAYTPPPALAFVETGIRQEVTARVRATVESAAALPASDYPHWWDTFTRAAPSTVAVAWGVMLWSAVSPVFDARLDAQLLGLWSSYRARPLPQVDGPRWLTPPPLETLIGLYAERLRAGRVDAAVVILRTMWAMAGALRDDPRFQARADALMAMLGTTLSNPTIDYGALPYGDGALVQQWLTRCPPDLAPALRVEAAPGEHFRNTYYDLADAVTPIAGDPAAAGYVEPRLLAAALLTADLAVVRHDVSVQVVGWLDPDVSAVIQAMLVQRNHPLRRLWPQDNRLPASLRETMETAGPAARDALLATMYATDLAWCRLGGGIPARPRGFPSPVAILAEILGPSRATSATESVTHMPGIAPLAHQYPANPLAADRPAAAPAVHEPPTGPPGQAPVWAAPADATGPASPTPPVPPAPTSGPTSQAASPSSESAIATEAWDPAGEVNTPPPPAGAWRGSDPADAAAPPATEAWDPASEVSAPLPPPATEAWMGSGERDAGFPIPPLPPFPADARAGVGDPGAHAVVPPESEARIGMPDEVRPPEGDVTYDVGEQTLLDSGDRIAQSPDETYVDPVGGTHADRGVPVVAPSPVPPPRRGPDPGRPPVRPPTSVLPETLTGDPLDAPMPERPVDQIEPPPPPISMPEVAERFGIRFVCGADSLPELLDRLGGDAADPRALGRSPALLIVGDPHRGQRRITRLIARTLAGAGVGDGTVRTTDAGELRGDPAEAVAETLRRAGPPLLFERLDDAVLGAPDPGRVAAAVTRAREDEAGRTPLIATCALDGYARLAARFPELTRVFHTFRLPTLADAEARLALVHILADERRVTISADAHEIARAELPRMGGRDDLVGARLVDAYLDRAVARHTARGGTSRDRLVLGPEDFAGVAEEIEPALRPARDVDGFLRTLTEMIGLEEVKRTVEGLVTEARMAADRAAQGLPSGNPSRHLIFLGRPGTGRTTVAGLIGGIYAALNLLDSGHLVVCDARDLIAEGMTAAVREKVDRAAGGVLLIDDAHLLHDMSVVQTELSRLMEQRRDKFMLVCSGLPDEMEAFLVAAPGFRAGFGAIVEFEEPTDRQLVQLFSRLAERDLYLMDEELRVELLERFADMRRSPQFAFAETVRRVFDQIIARQAARLAGAPVDTMAVARLSVRDLPDGPAG